MAKMTLLDYIGGHEYSVLSHETAGDPGGGHTPLGHPDIDLAERLGLLGLCGLVGPDEVWHWDGEGAPRDDYGEPITALRAAVDKPSWDQMVGQYRDDEA